MHTIVRGERRLKRRLLRRIYKEMIVNWIRKILGKKPIKIDEEEPDSED